MKKFSQTLLLTILLISCLSLARSTYDSYKKLDSLEETNKEIEALKAENKRLEEEKSFRQTDFYAEKAARDKLGLGKDGETVYIVEERPATSSPTNQEKKLANWQAWIELFF